MLVFVLSELHFTGDVWTGMPENKQQWEPYCEKMKNEILKQFFVAFAIASVQNMKAGTLMRQLGYFDNLENSATEVITNLGCYQCSQIAQHVCLENGEARCNNGKINMTKIMEKMKIAFHSTTYKDFKAMQERLSKANLTYDMKFYSEEDVRLYKQNT